MLAVGHTLSTLYLHSDTSAILAPSFTVMSSQLQSNQRCMAGYDQTAECNIMRCCTEDNIIPVYGMVCAGATNPDGSDRHYGWWMGDDASILGANTIWILTIIGWTMGMMLPFFYLLKFLGLLRVSPEEEMVS
jgi:Ammonium Transporter Family